MGGWTWVRHQKATSKLIIERKNEIKYNIEYKEYKKIL